VDEDPDLEGDEILKVDKMAALQYISVDVNQQ
jgi:hypothetical protein